MHLLFSVYLPLLPLQALRPSWSDPLPCAVIDAERVLVASSEALALGVRQGMRSGGVSAIAPETTMLPRDVYREEQALNAAVLALYAFTPDIAAEPDFGLLLDVGPSLKLFGGPRALAHNIKRALAKLGLSASISAAPTAMGAWLLARRTRQRHVVHIKRCMQMKTLHRQLDGLPCALLPATAPHDEWLHGIGARELGSLRRLPRQGLIRRTSVHLATALDNAYGDSVELRRWLDVPEVFHASLETHERVEHADALMDGATRLLVQMIGWLTVRQLAVSRFVLSLQHERGRAAIPPTPIEVRVAEPAWKEEHLLRLLKERLTKLELTAPVIGLQLDAPDVVPREAGNLSLFPDPGATQTNMLQLMELLTARLGPDRVLAPQPAPDHRPEQCNVWRPATAKASSFASDEEALARPFWLLRQPIRLLIRDDRPFYGSPLTLIQGPERIEGGWWDEHSAARDYYVAQGADASCFWIFQERVGEMQWYLHGLFA